MADLEDFDEPALYDFLIALQEDSEAGTLAAVESYIARFPTLEVHVRTEYGRLLEASTTSAHERRAQPELGRLGSYQLLRELGRGGQGEVYLALDEALGRRVALKRLSAPLGSITPERRERFRREAKLVAQLDHPGVCSIYEAKLDAEVPYIAMAFIEGRTLGQHIAAARSGERAADALPCRPRDERELERLLEFFEGAARALHAAHEAGVVHRDVKPGNLMVDAQGRPVVVDFGLARSQDPQLATLTGTNEVFGTPAYMSPEQLGLGAAPLDARTDVYSLGATLYEALTLAPPFEANGWPALSRAIQHEPVPDARLANPIVPHALHAILATAMDKDARRRYASALELAEDLARARARVSVLGRTPGRALRLARWSRRSPLRAAALSIALVVLVFGTGWRLQFQKSVEARDRRERELLSTMCMETAHDYEDQIPATALRHAFRASEELPGPAADSLVLRILDKLWEARRISAHSYSIQAVDVDPAGERALSADSSGQLTFWDIASATACVTPQKGAGSIITWAGFAPSGRLAASTARDGSVAIWSPTSAPAIVLGHHAGVALRAAFHPDGELLASCGADARLRLWSLSQRVELPALEHESLELTALAFSPCGRWLAGATRTSSGGCRLYLWSASSFERLAAWEAHAGALRHMAFLPDGTALLTASDDGSVRLWSTQVTDLPAGSLVGSLEHGAPVRHFDLDADGRRLVCAHDPDAEGQSITLWDLEGRKDSSHIALERGVAALEVRFDPRGERIGVQGSDNAIYLYSLPAAELERCLRGHQNGLVGFRWAAGGERLISASVTRYLHLWYARERPFLSTLRLAESPIVGLDFAPGANALRTRDRAGELRWLSWPQLQLLGRPPLAASEEPSPTPLEQASEGVLAARTTRDGARVRVLMRGGGRIESRAPGSDQPRVVELPWTPKRAHIGRDGQVAVVAPYEGEIRLYGPELGEPIQLWDSTRGPFEVAAFAPDGKSVASASASGAVKLWSTENGEVLLEYALAAPLWVGALAFDPQERSLVIGLGTGAILVLPLDVRAAALEANPWYNDLLGSWDRQREVELESLK